MGIIEQRRVLRILNKFERDIKVKGTEFKAIDKSTLRNY